MATTEDMKRITEALHEAGAILRRIAASDFEVMKKSGGSPVTEADLAVDALLRRILPRGGDGWLSEETADHTDRLACERVWIVDPLDGTQEFVARIPEWCVSIGLVEHGTAVAGGIYNPATEEMVVGAVGSGVELNGKPARISPAEKLDGVEVLASRSEVKRGEWERFRDAPFRTKPVGSVAYKMGLVAAGLTDATWTLVPKHEWDVAAGAALVRAAGGDVRTLNWEEPRFNQRKPKLTGLIACAPGLAAETRRFLRI
jgi:myo-inositol-1(or 4)-monophosphatase